MALSNCLAKFVGCKEVTQLVFFCSGVRSKFEVCPAFILHRRGKESAEDIHLTSGKVAMPQGEKINAAEPAALLNLSPSITFNED